MRVREPAVWAAAAWASSFAALHVHWVFGGRLGLGEGAAADAAFERGWFVTFNVVAAVLCTLAAVLALSVRCAWGGAVPQWVRRGGLWATAIVLSLRGTVGTVQSLSGRRTPAEVEAPVLLLYDPWFLVGGALFTVVAIGSRRDPT
jgi:hypothetical protein